MTLGFRLFRGRPSSTQPALPAKKLTILLAYSSRPPMGAKISPTMKKVGSTVLGVKMGCHAGNRCCLNGVSAD
ncbi:hypothetical protein BC936DRAFT_137421 [Jimgerdemannia flammicorona]|uniref:Uncharacterized protein n=2 Tax=Jimgerdemannia flammicorona TaxID=994334 RepID=A0A433CXF4_9FUNG|nr:hypothetical protein BC936DRAFT_137421 [Jimgerdemannia flammicorona]RUS32046.1 hypothetical protein BC938DRAFT_476386 [Jimgerdemannia flammicorona]